MAPSAVFFRCRPLYAMTIIIIYWRLCGTMFFAYLRIFILDVFVDYTSIVSIIVALAW